MNKYQKYKLIIFVIFSILFLLITHNYSNNGRYVKDSDPITVFDTRTGRVYFLSTKETRHLDIDDSIEYKKENEK